MSVCEADNCYGYLLTYFEPRNVRMRQLEKGTAAVEVTAILESFDVVRGFEDFEH